MTLEAIEPLARVVVFAIAGVGAVWFFVNQYLLWKSLFQNPDDDRWDDIAEVQEEQFKYLPDLFR